MSEDVRPIVVKRIKKVAGGHHGGAWKIAYADFVTAMMAFFLLMWLLGSTAQGDLQGIAEFFNSPLKVAMSGGSGAGDATSPMAGGGQDLTRSVGQVKRGDVEGKRSLNLEAAKGAVRASGDEGGQDVEKKREERKERARLEDVKGQIEAIIEASPSLRPFKSQLLLDITTEGLRISVSDNGCGIAPEIRDKLFTAFFTTKPEGMGVGLSICRSIIEFHRGRLWAEDNAHSPTGSGTIFHFTGQLAAGGVNVIAPCFAHGRHDACIIQDFAECLHCGLG